MNCPHCEISSLTTDGLERIACCGKCRGDWMTNRATDVVRQGNLIFLPFARHLAELQEDAALERKAA